jgi:tetratricopeptide (TPR) repeat protein
MTTNPNKQCSDVQMQEVLTLAARDTAAGIAAIDAILIEFPQDSRLHFLKGSMLIGEKRFIAAHAALSSAVALDPEFHLARFQLGFFELTSGEAETAQETWRPLEALPDDGYLSKFVAGLGHLIADRFANCIADLHAGIALNPDNLPLNNDMQLIVARCEEILAGQERPAGEMDSPVSATSLLLGATRRPNR